LAERTTPLDANPVPTVARGPDLIEPLAPNPVGVVERADLRGVSYGVVEPLPANPRGTVESADIQGVTYDIARPIHAKSMIMMSAGARNFLSPTVFAKINAVTFADETLTLTREEIDSIRWAELDKYAYEYLKGIFGQSRYTPPVANSNIEPGANVLVAGRVDNPMLALKPQSETVEIPTVTSTGVPADPNAPAPVGPVESAGVVTRPRNDVGFGQQTIGRSDTPPATPELPTQTAKPLPTLEGQLNGSLDTRPTGSVAINEPVTEVILPAQNGVVPTIDTGTIPKTPAANDNVAPAVSTPTAAQQPPPIPKSSPTIMQEIRTGLKITQAAILPARKFRNNMKVWATNTGLASIVLGSPVSVDFGNMFMAGVSVFTGEP
ncbi:MAG: hypothetical protein AAB834_04105, partial [Patescibacteria group bacterium]